MSVLGLGRVFTANMTGNVVFLGFDLAGASEFSISRSLAAFGSTKEQRTLETFYNGFGDGMATTSVDVTKIGTLLVDEFDAQSKKLVWRASSADTLSGSAEKNEKKLEKDVTDMFKHFPPQLCG